MSYNIVPSIGNERHLDSDLYVDLTRGNKNDSEHFTNNRINQNTLTNNEVLALQMNLKTPPLSE